MGKKSGDKVTYETDPRVGAAMEKEAALAESQQKWYENEIYPWMKEQTQKQNQYSEEDRALAKQNQEFWQNYAQSQADKYNAYADEYHDRWKNDFRPTEDALIKEANKYNTDAESERQAGLAMGDYASAFEQQRNQQNMQLQQYGINPTSGMYASANRAMNLQQAGMKAYAANQARSAAQELGWNKKMQVAQLGQNYINATNSAAQVANGSAQTAGALASTYSGQANSYGQQGLSNIGSLFNTGLNSFNSLQGAWGNYASQGMHISDQNYNAQLQQLQQNQANAAAGASTAASGMALAGSIAVAV